MVRKSEQPVLNNALQYNSVRKILQVHVSKEEQGLFWIWTENVYTGNTLIIKKASYYQILVEVFREMLRSIGNRQRLWCLCDSVHNSPTILAECKVPKNAVKSMIRIYQLEYNKEKHIRILARRKTRNMEGHK